MTGARAFIDGRFSFGHYQRIVPFAKGTAPGRKIAIGIVGDFLDDAALFSVLLWVTQSQLKLSIWRRGGLVTTSHR